MASFVSASMRFACAALPQVFTVCIKAVRKKYFKVSEIVCGLLPEECMSSRVSLGPSHQRMEQNVSDEVQFRAVKYKALATAKRLAAAC